MFFFFFFKQKTAYEIRPRDWSSDVCSSDLDLLGFGEIGVVPEAFRLVRLERVNIFLRVVDPDVAAPPLFRVLYLRQDEVRLDGLEDGFREKAGHDRFAAADVDVEIADAGFGLLDDPARDRRAARGNRFDVDAVAFFEAVLERLAQLAGRGDRDDDLAFFLPGFDDALPFAGFRLGERSRRRQKKNCGDE